MITYGDRDGAPPAIMSINRDIDRAGEIFREARQDLNEDLNGFSLVDLLADQGGWSLEVCEALAVEVVRTHRVSERIALRYGQSDYRCAHTEALAREAYQAYGASVEFKAFNGDAMPAWSELPERIKLAWRAAVVQVLISLSDYSEVGKVDADPATR